MRLLGRSSRRHKIGGRRQDEVAIRENCAIAQATRGCSNGWRRKGLTATEKASLGGHLCLIGQALILLEKGRCEGCPEKAAPIDSTFNGPLAPLGLRPHFLLGRSRRLRRHKVGRRRKYHLFVTLPAVAGPVAY